MFDRLPSLTALRAFEAAARHMSFAKAAAELNVTPGALSFQIKSLEEHLGALLFHRLNRAVELTEAGRALAPGCATGFTQLGAAWAATRFTLDAARLTVAAGPAFTAKWLAPRLYDFAQAHPEVELRVSASLRVMDFDRDGIDVAIRPGHSTDFGLWSWPLPDEWVTPVMTPELAARHPDPADLRDAVLMVDQSIELMDPACNWHTWFRAAGLPAPEPHGPRFSRSDHAVDAALAGVGVALGRRALVVKDLSEGRLVAPYGLALDTGLRFRFLCREGTENKPQIKAFRDWMQTEFDQTGHVSGALTILALDGIPPADPTKV